MMLEKSQTYPVTLLLNSEEVRFQLRIICVPGVPLEKLCLAFVERTQPIIERRRGKRHSGVRAPRNRVYRHGTSILAQAGANLRGGIW